MFVNFYSKYLKMYIEQLNFTVNATKGYYIRNKDYMEIFLGDENIEQLNFIVSLSCRGKYMENRIFMGK